jgi:hypothetical protein
MARQFFVDHFAMVKSAQALSNSLQKTGWAVSLK